MTLIFLLYILIYTNINIIFAQSTKYYQQNLNYFINVKLLEIEKAIEGKYKLIYKNNSPDTLKCIYFHCYYNCCSDKKKSHLLNHRILEGNYKSYFLPENKLGDVKNINFTVNGTKAYYYFLSDTPEVIKLILPTLLLPDSQVIIETTFYMKIPEVNKTRWGEKNQIFSITQWYLKPAVYKNKIWYLLPYLDTGEYFGEFANFYVKINVPINYKVASAGCLITEETKENRKIFEYKLENAHDFAWFASPYFKFEKDTLILNNQIIDLSFYYITPYINANYVLSFMKFCIKYLSYIFGDYPYKTCTVVETPELISGGMEYPTITNISKFSDYESFFNIIIHEIGHFWLYGILAPNERTQPFIDEGLNTFLTSKYREILKNLPYIYNKTYLNSHLFFDQFYFTLSEYYYFIDKDYPLNSHTNNFTYPHYYLHNYYKASYAWKMLYNFINKDNFINSLQNLYNNYKFTHIDNNTIYKSFLETLNNDSSLISWFFKDLLNTTNRPNYSINKVKILKDTAHIKIKNKNKTFFPLALYINDTLRKICLPNSKYYEIKFPHIKPQKICINQYYDFFESNYSNNCYYSNTLEKIKNIKFTFLGISDNIEKLDIFFLPILHFTKNTGLSPGIILYSPILPNVQTKNIFCPTFSIKNKKIDGYIYISKKIYKNLLLEYSFQKFSFPINLKNSFWFSNLLTIKRYTFKNYQDFLYYISFNYSTKPILFNQKALYNVIGLEFNKNIGLYHHKLNPLIECGITDNYIKFKLNYSLSIVYNEKGNKFGFDFFYGKFLINKTNLFYTNFFLSGRPGYIDFLYENFYFNREYTLVSQNFLNKQIYFSEGFFSTSTFIQTNRWLSSLRIWYQLPTYLPLFFYISFGLYSKDLKQYYNTYIPYECGVELRIIKDHIAIYLPFYTSPEIKNLYQYKDENFLQKIRFSFNINYILMFKNLNKIHKHLNKLFYG